VVNQSVIAHLLRRSGFGPTTQEVAAADKAGYSATVDSLIGSLGAPDPLAQSFPPPTFDSPAADYRTLRQARQLGDTSAVKSITKQLVVEHRTLTNWWLARMVAASPPLTEKLTFLLHGHFPTAISKVRFPAFMYGQNQLFRTLGPGPFDQLTQAVSADPAMLIWLDASSDKAADPNENFARELMERFTMGIGTYHEADVRAAAYCFTGWRLDLATDSLTIDQRQHSPVVQQVLGQPVNTGQQVIQLVTHTPASTRYVPAAFWSHLAYPVSPSDPVVSDLTPVYAQDLDITSLLRAIFQHPEFVSATAQSGLVKQPTEYVVGALRSFGITGQQVMANGTRLQATLAAMGQILFDPPSVGGWPQNQYWLSTAAALTRWHFAERLTGEVDLSPIADASPGARPEALAEMLSVPAWSNPTAAALSRAGGDPQRLAVLALTAPEYLTN
jgi:uncharacterized protein (DUF1800 family)